MTFCSMQVCIENTIRGLRRPTATKASDPSLHGLGIVRIEIVTSSLHDACRKEVSQRRYYPNVDDQQRI